MQKHLQKRIEEVTEQIELATDPDWIAWGLITRAAIQKERGNTEAALEDLGAAIDLSDIPLEKLEEALRARSWIMLCANKYAAALMDIERIIFNPEMPGDLLGGAKMQRIEIYRVADLAGVDLDCGTIQ